MGGKDAASPRYIFTYLEELTRIIINSHDDILLNYLEDDGMKIEPEYFVPIIPMVLVNGAEGIGTGYSTHLYNYNPEDIIHNLLNMIDDKPFEDMIPWYKGFKGTITKFTNPRRFKFSGKYTLSGNNKVIVTELPVGTWTTKYREELDKLENGKETGKKVKKVSGKMIEGYVMHGNDEEINFEIKFNPDVLGDLIEKDKLESTLQLVKEERATNMHLFNYKGKIQKYENEEEIMREFFEVRYDFYVKRKAYLIDKLENELDVLKYKMMFIQLVIDGKIKINNQPEEKIIESIIEYKIPESTNGYEYLLSIPIRSFTKEKIKELQTRLDNKEEELTNVRATTEKDQWKKELHELLGKYKEFVKSN